MANGNTYLGGIEVGVSVRSDQFATDLQKIKNQISKFENVASKGFKGVSVAAVAVGNVISSAFTAAMRVVASQVDNAVARLDTLNNFPKVMSNLNISAERSTKVINYLSDKLRGLPTALDAAALSVQRFTSANGNIEASTEMFLALNNALLAGGAGIEVQNTALEQMSQAYAKGKPDMMEWRSLLTAMPAQLNQVATAMGYASSDELGEALRNGKLSMNDFMMTLIKLNKEGVNGFESFETQARNATNGVATAFANLKTAITRGLTTIMQAIGESNIVGFLGKVGQAFETVAAYAAAVIRIIKEAVAWISVFFGGSGSTADLVKETKSASDNMGGVASGASDTADNLNDATSAAKKLNKQLAGFDEMNVLKSPDNSSGGGSGSGGSSGGVGSLGDFEWNNDFLNNTEDKIGAIVDKIKAKFAEFFDGVDFSKLEKSFAHLLTSIKKFANGAGKVLGGFIDNFLKPFANWTVGEALPHFFESTANAFDQINWDKITDAFNELWRALEPFAETVGEGLLWFYDNALIPLGLWTVNDFLPAFLHALAGAIELVTKVIQAMAPFFDAFWNGFLKPIAEFTGGIIVSVLQGIGDALSWIAGNEAAVTVIATAIETFAMYEIITKASSAVNGFLRAFQAAAAGLTQESATLAGGGGLFSTFGAKVGIATDKVKGFKGVMQGIGDTIFSPATIATELATLAVLEYQAAVLYCKIQSGKLKFTESQRIDVTKLATEADKNLNDAIQRQKELKDELKDATSEVTNSQLNLIDCQKNVKSTMQDLTNVASKYGLTVDQAKAYVDNLDLSSGNLSDKDMELAEVVYKATQAEERQETATKRLSDAKDTVSQKTEEMSNQQWKEIASTKEAELVSKLAEGKYQDVTVALKEMARGSGEFQTENGEMVKYTKQEMAQMADQIGEDLARINTGSGTAWNGIWTTAKGTVNNLSTVLTNEYYNAMVAVGENSGKGYAKGIENSIPLIINSSRKGAQAGINEVQRTINAHSPSRVMMKYGGFFSQGFAIGIEDETSEVEKAAAELANVAIDTFDDYENDINLAPLSTNLSKQISGMLDVEAEQTPVHVVVNVGEETLINKIVDGMNDLSFMTNRSVVNV